MRVALAWSGKVWDGGPTCRIVVNVETGHIVVEQLRIDALNKEAWFLPNNDETADILRKCIFDMFNAVQSLHQRYRQLVEETKHGDPNRPTSPRTQEEAPGTAEASPG